MLPYLLALFPRFLHFLTPPLCFEIGLPFSLNPPGVPIFLASSSSMIRHILFHWDQSRSPLRHTFIGPGSSLCKSSVGRADSGKSRDSGLWHCWALFCAAIPYSSLKGGCWHHPSTWSPFLSETVSWGFTFRLLHEFVYLLLCTPPSCFCFFF